MNADPSLTTESAAPPPAPLRRMSTRRLLVAATAAAVMIAVLAIGLLRWRAAAIPAEPGTATGKLTDNSRDVQLQLVQCRRAAARGDFKVALQHADKALLRAPESVEALLLRAELLYQLHRADEMIGPLRQVLRQDPARFEAHANLAYALRFAGQLDAAEQEARWCLESQPEFVPALRLLAEVQRDRGQIQDAMASIRQARALAPDDLDSGLLQAELQLYHRDFESAYQTLQPLLAPHTGNHRLLSALSRACQLTGRDREARQYRAQLGR